MSVSVLLPGFISRKNGILEKLAVPDSQYTDLSPKGSVDEGIRDLIHEINALEGLVTTSSCAGRVAVFAEGNRPNTSKRDLAIENRGQIGGKSTLEKAQIDSADDEEPQGTRQFGAAGGKGTGRWLYVSHDPVLLEEGKQSLHQQFGLMPGNGVPRLRSSKQSAHPTRLVRFLFEPMILHIMAASLQHARPVLAAASSAGFRESGLQSLRCLELDVNMQKAQGKTDSTYPIVAVRSSGLALESIIGYCEGEEEIGHNSEDGDAAKGSLEEDSQQERDAQDFIMRSLVTEEYLSLLIMIANERFEENKRRIDRFRTNLLRSFSSPLRTSVSKSFKMQQWDSDQWTNAVDWEDPIARRERKRAEGLQKQSEIAQRNRTSENEDIVDDDTQLSLLVHGMED